MDGSANNPNPEERTSIKSLHEEFDEAGERVSPKELFKRLCHRFHGRTPGKRKTEAKRRKLERTKRQKRCRSVDSVPNTVQAPPLASPSSIGAGGDEAEDSGSTRQPFVVLWRG
jgi:hypothetical protein